MKTNLLQALATRHIPLLADGGMGTQLMAMGLVAGESSLCWNLAHPERVAQVHQRYYDAGCRLLTTNTFQGSAHALAHHGLADQAHALNRGGAELIDALGVDAWILADAGPFGGFMEPLGDVSRDEAKDLFVQQFQALREGGADAALAETMSDTAEVAVAIEAARSVADWPVIASFAFQKAGEQFVTMMGTPVTEAVATAVDAGADIVGANCGTSLELDDYLRLAGQLCQVAGNRPVMLQPNAGNPVEVDGALQWPASGQDMGRLARQLAGAGVAIIGGCCGTTPAHLAAMHQALTSSEA